MLGRARPRDRSFEDVGVEAEGEAGGEEQSEHHMDTGISIERVTGI